jgi:hypothetical protein
MEEGVYVVHINIFIAQDKQCNHHETYALLSTTMVGCKL